MTQKQETAVGGRNQTEKVIAAMLAMQRHPWEQGVCAQALFEAGRADLWIPMAYDAVKRQSADGRLAMVGGGAAVSDPAANGEVCLRAYERTGDRFFLEGAEKMLDYLLHAAPRTEDGIICHNEASFEEGFSASQLWADGMYMVPPFLAVMGRMTEAKHQIRGYLKHLMDPETGLFFHIRDVGQDRFVRRKRWATGNGWALMGLIRIASEARKCGQAEMEQEMLEIHARVIDAMIPRMTPEGRFHDLLDEEESFEDSASALMMAASVFRGMAEGMLDDRWLSPAEKALEAAGESIDEYGLIRHVCGCPHFTEEGTSAEAQAAYIMASALRGRLSGRTL